MKKLIAALAFIGLAGTASAAPNCARTSDVYSILMTKYGEQRRGIGLLQEKFLVELWTNEETDTFTILVTRPDNISCIAIEGTGWAFRPEEIIPEGEPT